MNEYRKKKSVPALYRDLNGGEARIWLADIPDKAKDDFCIYNGDTELDITETTDQYILVDTEGVEVDELTVAYDPIPEKEEKELDLSPLTTAIKNVEDAIYATEGEDVDNAPVIALLDRINASIRDVNIPEVPDYLPALKDLKEAIVRGQDNSAILERLEALVNKETPVFEIPSKLISGDRIKVEVDRVSMGGGGSDNSGVESRLDNLVGFEIPAHDYISLAQDTLTDTWTYKTGGSGGTTVATVTVTYTDSGKGTIASVAKT